MNGEAWVFLFSLRVCVLTMKIEFSDQAIDDVTVVGQGRHRADT